MFTLVTCCACRRDAVIEHQVSIAAYRAIAETEDGGQVIELDAKSLPIIRIEDRVEALELFYTSGQTRVKIDTATPETREGGTLLRVEKLPAIDAGRLELFAGDRLISSWRVHVQPARVELTAAIDRAKAAQAKSDTDATAAAWADCARAAIAARVPSETSRCLRAEAYAHRTAGRFNEAFSRLDAAELIDRRIKNVGGLARADFYRGLFAQDVADYQRAIAALERAASLSFRHGLAPEHSSASRTLALLLQDEGLHQEALARIEALTPYFETTANQHEKGWFYVDYGWVLARGMASGAFPRELARAEELFTKARELLRELADAQQNMNIATNLMWVAYLDGRMDDAKRAAEEVRRLDPKRQGSAGLFARIVEAQIELAAGHHREAEAAFAETLALARNEAGGESDYSWRAAYGVALAKRARGDRKGAREAFDTALAALDRVGKRTELRGARAPFFGDRRQLFDDAIELLLELELPADAFAVAELARTSVLRALEGSVRVERLSAEARAEWNRRLGNYLELRNRFETSRAEAELLAGKALAEHEKAEREMRDELEKRFEAAYAWLDQNAPELLGARSPLLAADEALLAFAQIRGRWLVFSLRNTRVRAKWVEKPALPMNDRELEGAAHLYIVPADLEVEGAAAWLENKTLSFLPYAALLAETSTRPNEQVVVVADPDNNLLEARNEGAAVASRLNARTLIGDAARRADVLKAIDGASLFHFAGHGVLRPNRPWDAHLSLAGAETLSLEDLLVARPRVGIVVLSGCETGKPLALSESERIGLPEAFLVSGARTVIATLRPVRDDEARAFMGRFYAEGGASQPVEAYRRAVLAVKTDAFRVLGRR